MVACDVLEIGSIAHSLEQAFRFRPDGIRFHAPNGEAEVPFVQKIDLAVLTINSSNDSDALPIAAEAAQSQRGSRAAPFSCAIRHHKKIVGAPQFRPVRKQSG